MGNSLKTGGVAPRPALLTDEVFAFPLSYAQQRLWVLDRLESRSAAYNIPLSIRLQGSLHFDALRRSVASIVQRHEVLRASFEQQGDRLVQVIPPANDIALPLVDLTNVPEQDRLPRAQALAGDEAAKSFDLARGPVFRTSLLKLAEDDHVLLFTVHHIAFDGWSERVFVGELKALYAGYCAGKSPELPDLPLQYTDYSVWQRQYLSGPRLQQQLEYWKAQLAGAPTALELPTDHPRPPRQTYRGGKLATLIPLSLLRELKGLSRREGVTLFMTLLGTFSALLARYSAQEDIVIGSPIAGRNRVEFENVIGLFVNTLALRTNLSGNPSFRELLTRVREATLGAYAHQDLPFEKIVEELRPERDLSRNPIFQVMFAMQNVPGERENVPGLSITRFAAADKATAKFDLLATATERSDGLRMTFEYSTDLFAATTIQRMQQHYLNLLQAVVVDPNCSVGELPLLGPDERQQQITVWNQTSAAIPAICIHEAFEAQAHRRPSAIAVTFDGKNLTYSELNRRADCLANYLCGLGVRPETLVGIYLDRSLEMVIALLAVLKAGGAYVPLDPSFPAERIGFILADAEVSVLLTSEALRGNVPSHGAQVICIDRHWSSISEAPAASTRGTVTPANLAYVLYTSGSTGKPKGVAVEHSAVVNFLESMRREPGLSSEDVLLAVTTLSFDIAGLELYLPLTSGAQVVIAGSHDVVNAKKLISLLEHSKTTVMQATPATWRMLLDSGWKGSSKLKALCGGEALPGQLAQQLQQCCRELWNLYGPTETTIWSSLYRVEEPNEATVSIGKPIANTQMYVLDRQRNLLPVGAVGELYIGGAGLARGYWQRPELTAEKFVVNPFGFSTPTRLYRTGDLVRYLPDGNLQYVARLDNQVKVRGHRIELEEIEFSLSAHPLVQEVVVIVREDTPGDQRLVAYVVSRNGAPLSVVDLRVHLKETLPDYMIPSAFVQMDQLPLTPNRKIDRRSLPPPQNFGTGRAESPGARDDLEQTLVSIWETVLGIQGIGIRDNFFELGGHSLLAVRLVAEILAATGKDVPLAALFQGATVEYLASLLRDEGQPSHQMVIEIQRGSSEQKFFAIVTPGINALGYRTLAHYLGPEQSFYRIQGPGPRVTERPYSASEFEKMAREYIRAMKAVQPKGPYYLGGMCEGARIAFDMARALEADGEQVGLLAIFDTWVLENSQNRLLWKINYFSGRIKRFQRLPITQKRALMKKWASNLLYPEARARSTWPQAYWPGNHFVPAKYRGKITVFKFRNQPYYYVNDPLMGWGSRTTGKVELQVMNLKIRKHMLLFREPYVNELAKKLAECLARAVPNNVNQRHAERADSPLILPGPQLTSVEP